MSQEKNPHAAETKDFGFALFLGVTGFALGAGAGAAVMYLFDPDRGRRRRAGAKDQLGHAGREVASSLAATASDVRNRTKGLVHEVARRLSPDEEVDDETLKSRVRSALGHVTSHPHSLVVSCDNGRVTVAGPALQSELDDVLGEIKKVPGVKSVRDLLELHESAEGVPALQASVKESKDEESKEKGESGEATVAN